MKKLFVVFLLIALLCCTVFCTPVSAAPLSEASKITVEYLENGDYIETIISEDSLTRSSKSGTKTKNYKNSNGDIMWSVTVRGTYTYDGIVALCTSCSHSTSVYSSAWSIKNSSSSRSGNTATANATATLKMGLISQDYSMSVSLSCNANGTLS